MRTNSRPRVKIPTPERLSNVALHYLGRFAASEQSLRKVLQNRIRKAAMADPGFAADSERQTQLRAAIETIIEKHRRTGALNDKAYAEMKVRGLRRAGKSARAISQKLAAKGVGREVAAASLGGGEESEGDPEADELKAARIFARRKKLGPFRAASATTSAVSAASDMQRKAAAQKDMAAMARNGFSYDVIRKILGGDATDEEDFG